MPKGLVETDTVELNYIAARDDQGLNIALMNQSGEAVRSTIRINPDVAGFDPSGSFEVLVRDGNTEPKRTMMRNAKVDVRVGPKGITTLNIPGLVVKSRFQDRLLSASQADRWTNDYVELKTGDARAMILNFGPKETSAFIYLREDDSKWEHVALKHSVDGGSEAISKDGDYPFEFTLEIPPGARRVVFELEATTRADNSVMKEKGQLTR
jgi:hypothetical protein